MSSLTKKFRVNTFQRNKHYVEKIFDELYVEKNVGNPAHLFEEWLQCRTEGDL